MWKILHFGHKSARTQSQIGTFLDTNRHAITNWQVTHRNPFRCREAYVPDEIWEWISNFMPHFTVHVIAYPCFD